MNLFVLFRSSARAASSGSYVTCSLLAASALFALASAACSDDAAEANNYIGVTDATPPRLGTTDGDAGANTAATTATVK